MNKVDLLSEEIYRRFGTIKRAKNCFLYTAKGVRLTDLFQENGRAILGWGGGSAFTQLKNVLSRGITGSYRTDFTKRLEKACTELFASERKVYIYSDKQKALENALKVFSEDTAVWMPWKENEKLWRNTGAIVFAPPLPWTSGIYILALLDDSESSPDKQNIYTRISKDAIKLPAPVEAAVTRSIYDMISAVQSRSEKDWFMYDQLLAEYWTRKGPYLYPKIPEEKYDDFVIHCLECNLVISPVYELPSIIPFGADKGVFTILKQNPFPL